MRSDDDTRTLIIGAAMSGIGIVVIILTVGVTIFIVKTICDEKQARQEEKRERDEKRDDD